jgi:hypothetical protein
MRDKFMSYEEFSPIQQYEWLAVKVSENARPPWMKNVPTGMTLASGTLGTGMPHCGSGAIVGGIDHYRLAPEDPVDYNKDKYLIVSGLNPNGLMVIGPSKDSEHWTNSIPSYVWDL